MIVIDRFQHFRQKLFLRYNIEISRNDYQELKKIRAKPEKYYTRTRLVRQTLKRKAVKIGYKNRDILAIYDKGTRQLITVLFNRGLKHYQLKKHRWNKSG